jgi:hypothetical protein
VSKTANSTAFVVEIRVNGTWLPAQRVTDDFPTEAKAIAAAVKAYPITVAIQKAKGPVGIRVIEVVLATP